MVALMIQVLRTSHLRKKKVSMQIKRLSSFINEVAAKGDWCVYDTKTGKVHSIYSSHKKAIAAMTKLNNTHDGYETPGNLIQDKFGAKVVKESTLDEGKVEQGHTFQVGDVVEVVWKDISGETKHGTANIDSATSAYATATHPTIKDLKIKVHQGINGKGGNETGTNPGTRAGGYKFIKKASTNEASDTSGDVIVSWTNRDYKGSTKIFKNDPQGAPENAMKTAKAFIAKMEKTKGSDIRSISAKWVTNESTLTEGENLTKLVNYAKANPEIGDAVGLVVKKYISKVNANVSSIINSTVKETGVPKQKLIDALTELGFTELTGEA
jgi:hypothetical protein